MGKYIKLFDNHSGYSAFTQTEEFVKPNVSHCISENEVHYNPIPMWGEVDLGLSVKWAKMNVGANSDTDYGLFFAWGDISGYTAAQVGSGEGQKYFGWVNNGVNDYKYANGAYTKLTKYCNDASYGNDGFTDSLTTLELSDDAAHAASGGQYRMPTKDECLELASGTINGFVTSGGVFTQFNWIEDGGYLEPPSENPTTADTNNKFGGVAGHLFFKNTTSVTDALSSGEYLFLPACGRAYNGSVGGAGQWGYYWSSSLHETYPYSGWRLHFGAGNAGVYGDGGRCYGHSIRGVLNQ